MTIGLAIRRYRPRPLSITMSRLCFVTVTCLVTCAWLLGTLYFSVTAVTSRETTNKTGLVLLARIEDQIQSPLLREIDADDTPRGDDSLDFDTDVRDRRQRYLDLCSSAANSRNGSTASTSGLGKGVRSFITHDEGLNMAYCFVAKIGCTFWLRIFTFLTRKEDMTRMGIDSPFDIDRIELHTGQMMTKVRLPFREFKMVAKPDTLKFLFTRNPYERLWSVFLDKYYLPDYWMLYPLGTSKCGVNTTFSQFLNAAVTLRDHHLTPVTTACDPCTYRPDVIGKMETFSRDSKRILAASGYAHLNEKHGNHSAYTEIELTSLIAYNFRLLAGLKHRLKDCLTATQISRRLWHVFQINGHIRDSIPFPQTHTIDSNDNNDININNNNNGNNDIDNNGNNDINNNNNNNGGDNVNERESESKSHDELSVSSATELFLKTVRENPMTKIESRLQRRRFLVEAYSNIAPSVILEIQDRYKWDFAMFDYDTAPPY